MLGSNRIRFPWQQNRYKIEEIRDSNPTLQNLKSLKRGEENRYVRENLSLMKMSSGDSIFLVP